MCPYLDLFDCFLPAYDLMLVLGFILAACYWYKSGVDIKLDKRRLFLVILLGFFVQLAGGMVIPFIYHKFILHDNPTLKFWESCPGRYFHSSFIFTLLGLILISKALKWPVRKLMDNFMVAAMIMSAVGRIGCLLQGCCSGKPTGMPWAVRFLSNPDAAVHPTQIYMFLSEMAILWILMNMRKKQRYDGQIFWTGIFIYSIYRILIEFYRTNPVFLAGLTHAQFFSMITLVLSGLVIFFYRDPERAIDLCERRVLSPADGRVNEIASCDSGPSINGPCSKISVYLSLFDVHVNRSPIGGTVESVRYSPGEFRFAFDKDAPAYNENNVIAITGAGTKVAVKQIAGKLTRRIVCYCKEGDHLRQGDRIGMIEFGSCVQVYVPANFKIKIGMGEKVRAGKTVLAALE